MVYRLNKAAFDYVIGEIHAKFMTSKVRKRRENQVEGRSAMSRGVYPSRHPRWDQRWKIVRLG